MNVAVRIQHHPSRAKLIKPLLKRLDGLADVEVVKDPGGPKPSSWRSHRACLQAIPDEASHLVVLQDDCVPCVGFPERLLAAIEQRPARLIALFVPGISHLARRVAIERKRGSQWLEFPSTSFVPLVGVVYPAAIAREIVPFAEARRIGVGRADDAVVGAFARAHRLTACAVLPSLVEHLDAAPSVMRMPHGRGKPHRLAAWYESAPAEPVPHPL